MFEQFINLISITEEAHCAQPCAKHWRYKSE